MLLLRPKQRFEVDRAEARAYFSSDELERATKFRRGQLALYGARSAVELASLVAAARLAPPAGRRPVATGAAAAAAITLAQHAGRAPAARRLAPAVQERGTGHTVLGRLGGRPRQGRRDRRRDVGGGRRRADRRRPALRPRLVGARLGGGDGLRGRLHLPGPGRAGPDVQPLHAARGRRHPRRRARARGQGRARGRRGLRGRRLAPHDRGQRLRHGDRPHQARRALRHAAEGLHARRDAARGRARARARQAPRRRPRPAVAGARGAVRDARRRARRRDAARARARRPSRPSRSRSPCSRPRWRRSPTSSRARSSAARTRSRSTSRTSRTRWWPSSAGSRCRTSAIPTRRAGSRSCSARTRPRWSGSARRLATRPREAA